MRLLSLSAQHESIEAGQVVYRRTCSEASPGTTQSTNSNRGVPSLFNGFSLQPATPVQSSYVGKVEKGASLTVKNIGKPCTGEPYARFDEGALKRKASLEHVVAACGEASLKDLRNPLNQCSTLPGISPRNIAGISGISLK